MVGGGGHVLSGGLQEHHLVLGKATSLTPFGISLGNLSMICQVPKVWALHAMLPGIHRFSMCFNDDGPGKTNPSLFLSKPTGQS